MLAWVISGKFLDIKTRFFFSASLFVLFCCDKTQWTDTIFIIFKYVMSMLCAYSAI